MTIINRRKGFALNGKNAVIFNSRACSIRLKKKQICSKQLVSKGPYSHDSTTNTCKSSPSSSQLSVAHERRVVAFDESKNIIHEDFYSDNERSEMYGSTLQYKLSRLECKKTLHYFTKLNNRKVSCITGNICKIHRKLEHDSNNQENENYCLRGLEIMFENLNHDVARERQSITRKVLKIQNPEGSTKFFINFTHSLSWQRNDSDLRTSNKVAKKMALKSAKLTENCSSIARYRAMQDAIDVRNIYKERFAPHRQVSEEVIIMTNGL